MKKFYYKYRIFLIPVISGIICMLVLILVIIPETLELFKEKARAEELISKVEQLNNKASELKNIDEESMKKDLVVALTVLPTEREVPQAMSVLQNLVTNHNLSLKNTSYQSTSKTGGENSFTFVISVEGSLSSIKNFINELQNSARVFKVESITLTFSSNGSLVEANIPLTVFYEPVPKTLLITNQPIEKISNKDQELIKNLSKIVSQSETESTAPSSIPLGKTNPFE